MNLRIWGSFSGFCSTWAKILPESSCKRTIWAEIVGSAILSSSRFISAMAFLPSSIILSSSALPVDFGSSGTSSTVLGHSSRATMPITAAAPAAST